MQELSAAADPNQANVLTGGPLSMPKRELFEHLPEIITINVKTMSMVAEVNVLADWRLKGVLKLEITKTNLDLLLEQPSAATAPWTPTIEQPDVCWRNYTKSVYCRYWDNKKSTQRLKSMSVEMSSDMDHEDKLVAVSRAACEVQKFYDSHHNQTGNMPRKRDRESDDDEEDDDLSAARSESVRKAAKPACAETEKDTD